VREPDELRAGEIRSSLPTRKKAADRSPQSSRIPPDPTTRLYFSLASHTTNRYPSNGGRLLDATSPKRRLTPRLSARKSDRITLTPLCPRRRTRTRRAMLPVALRTAMLDPPRRGELLAAIRAHRRERTLAPRKVVGGLMLRRRGPPRTIRRVLHNTPTLVRAIRHQPAIERRTTHTTRPVSSHRHQLAR
jgi:hypothetical protein